MSLTLPIDTVAILDPDQPVEEVGEVLCSSISDQLIAIEKCLCQFAEVGAIYGNSVRGSSSLPYLP